MIRPLKLADGKWRAWNFDLKQSYYGHFQSEESCQKFCDYVNSLIEYGIQKGKELKAKEIRTMLGVVEVETVYDLIYDAAWSGDD